MIPINKKDCDLLIKKIDNKFFKTKGNIENMVFAYKIAKNLKIDYSADYIKLSSYKGGTKSSGKIDIDKNIRLNIKDKKILIIEDIIDTGKTIKKVYNYILFYLSASYKHDIHSPFVFEFIEDILENKNKYYCKIRHYSLKLI